MLYDPKRFTFPINEQSEQDQSDLALFLSAPILLDSYNFEPKIYKSKWTDEDKTLFEHF